MLLPIQSIICVSVLSLTAASARVRPRVTHDAVKREIAYHEERFINTLSWKLPNETMKVVGCKKFKIPPQKLEDFEDDYEKNYHKVKTHDAHFYDEALGEIRVYFPVAGALIEHQGSYIEANDVGEFQIEDVDGDYAVLGRYQTDHIHGVPGNIIKDGIIFLAEKAYPTRVIENTFIYDFGYRDFMHDHDDHPHGKRGDAVWDVDKGCYTNHGNENCSDKFNIHNKSPCTENHKTCMDYNGADTNCIKGGEGKPLHFIGSDCYTSVTRGHCWNEMVTNYYNLPAPEQAVLDVIPGLQEAMAAAKAAQEVESWFRKE
jgi:hypothetical protein